ncbi:hypothetical protein ES708_30934 [subsurface metagenome]
MKQSQNKNVVLDEKILPDNWIDSQECDAETLVEITREMTSLIYEKQIEFEDSRCFYRLCIDMTKKFQKSHKDFDWAKEDFLTEIINYSELVRSKLKKYPNWINTDYKWMSGKDNVSDLLKK